MDSGWEEGSGGRERMGEDGRKDGCGHFIADTPGRLRDRHGTCTALSSIMGLWDYRTPYRLHRDPIMEIRSFPLSLFASLLPLLLSIVYN